MANLGPQELKANPLFQYLELEEIDRVLGMAQRESFQKGESVFRQDDEAKKLYLVEKGLIAMVLQISPDRQLTIVTEGRGGAFGWAALLPPHKHSAVARCSEATDLLAIDGPKLRELCFGEPALGVRLMQGVAQFIAARLYNTNLVMLNAMWR